MYNPLYVAELLMASVDQLNTNEEPVYNGHVDCDCTDCGEFSYKQLIVDKRPFKLESVVITGVDHLVVLLQAESDLCDCQTCQTLESFSAHVFNHADSVTLADLQHIRGIIDSYQRPSILPLRQTASRPPSTVYLLGPADVKIQYDGNTKTLVLQISTVSSDTINILDDPQHVTDGQLDDDDENQAAWLDYRFGC